LGAGAWTVGDFLGAAFFEAGFAATGLAASCTAGALAALELAGTVGFFAVAMKTPFLTKRFI